MAQPSYIAEDGTLTDGEAWVAIATTDLTSDTGSVTFTSDSTATGDWSQYLDLMMICHVRGTNASTAVGGYLRFNDDTGNNYNFLLLDVDTNAPRGYSEASHTKAEAILAVPAGSSTANVFGAAVVHFADINSGKDKVVLIRSACDQNNTTTHGSGSTVCQWRNQAAITKILAYPSSGNWKSDTRFDLYGILPRMVS